MNTLWSRNSAVIGSAQRMRAWTAIGSVLLAWLVVSNAAAAPLAMLTDLQGKATISHSGRVVDATILSELEVGAQLQLAVGAMLTILLFDTGDEWVFKGPALVAFRGAVPDVISGAKPEKRTPAIGKSVRLRPVGLVQGAVAMRSLGGLTRIRLTRLDATHILERSPTFRWHGPLEGLNYQIELADETGRMLHQATVSESSYSLPAALVLNEGSAYRWTVTAQLPGGRSTSTVGNFQIAGDALRQQARQMQTDPTAPVSERVAYAAWLDQVDLKDAARLVWRALAAERPDDSRLKALAQ